MRILSEADAARSFGALLDEVEQGGSFIITRGDKRIAALAPAPAGNGAALLAALASGPDPEFASDVAAALRLVQ